MSVEYFVPGSLKGYTDLEMRAREYLPEIMVVFDDLIESGVGLIDESFELQNIALKDASDTLSYFILEYKDIEAEAAAYRAVHFAYLLRSQMERGEIPLKFGPYFNQLPEDAPGTTLIKDTQLYFQHRPALDTLTGRFMPYLDPSRNFVHMAEAITALTLMRFDYTAREAFIDKLVEEEFQGSDLNSRLA